MAWDVVRGHDERGWYFQAGTGTRYRFDPDDHESLEQAKGRALRQAQLRREEEEDGDDD